jgi:nucleoside-diphosphate-sugar epimerase
LSTRKTVLITGAAGRIGSFLTGPLAERYDLVLTDTRQPEDTRDHPFTQADIADMEAMRAICRGVHTVVHLAADPSTRAAWESLLPANVIGVYNVFQAAHEAGCRRVVFASSINAVSGYGRDVQVHTHMPVRPPNLYGATKAWGEALARFYADQHNMSMLCLRFGAVAQPGQWIQHLADSDLLDIVLTFEDLGRLVIASIDAPDDLRFGIFHGLSNNRWKRLDLSDTREVLGYQPQDDAFALVEHAQAPE